MKGGECVVSGMKCVDPTRALSLAVYSHKMTIADYLLSKSSEGSCLLLGVKVTEDMLTIVGQSSEMRELWRCI